MGVQKTPQGIIGRKKPCNSLQIDVWLCLILLLVLVNPTLPIVFFAEGNVAWHPKELARSCCDFFFCYLRKSPPLSQADTELKNCFFLWCMDIKKKKKTFVFLHSATERAETMSLSPLWLQWAKLQGVSWQCKSVELGGLQQVCMTLASPAGLRSCVLWYHLFSVAAISIFY